MKRKILLVLSLCLLFINEVKAGNYIPYPVIFVHGFASSDAKAWTNTKNNLKTYYLDRYDYTNINQFFPQFDYESRNNDDITKIAIEDLGNNVGQRSLKTTIDLAISNSFPSNYTGEKKVILVCHSMGGLVTRSLLKKDETGDGTGHSAHYYRDLIDKIIFIGTPHNGSPLASGMYLLTQENIKLVSTSVELISEISYASQIGSQNMVEALTDLKENLDGVIITNGDIITFYKDRADVDAYGNSIKEMVVPSDIESKLKIYGQNASGDYPVMREISSSYPAGNSIASGGKLSQLSSSNTRLILGRVEPTRDLKWYVPFIFEVEDQVQMMKFSDVPAIVSLKGELLDDNHLISGPKVVSRSYNFPDLNNSIDCFESQDNLTDGIVTLASQAGVPSDKAVQIVNFLHTEETDQWKEILKFLDEQPPEIEFVNTADDKTIKEGGYTNAQVIKIKVKEGTENSGISGIDNVVVKRGDTYPELVDNTDRGLEYDYTLGGGVFRLVDGIYYVRATDIAGNIKLSTFTIDTVNPDAAITSPNSNVITTRYITISGTASDNKELHKVDITITKTDTNSEPEYISRLLNGAETNWSIGSYEVSDGNWKIKAKVYDKAGNETSKETTFTVRIDTNTNEDDSGEGNNDPRIRDRDNDGLSDDMERQLGTDPNNFDSDGGGLNDGAEIAQGKDPLDPSDDNAVPFIQITNPTPGQIFTTSTIGVSGNANTHTNIQILKVEVNGQDCDITPATAVEFSKTIEVSEGNNKEIAATYTDQTGNKKTARVYITVDKTPPEVHVYPLLRADDKVVGKIHYTVNYTACQYAKSYERDLWYPIKYGGDWIDTTSGIALSGVNFTTSLGGVGTITEKGVQGCDNKPSEGPHTIMATVRDKAGNISEPKTSNFTVIWKEITMPSTLNGPSCDTPDDNESISKPELIALGPINNNRPIGLIANGVAPFTESLITNITQEPVDYIFLDNLENLDVDKYRLIVIPTGGLMAGNNSGAFKQKLQDYVNNGGTILCFAQQYGYEFGALPTNSEIASSGTRNDTISAYGWMEDQSCQSNSTYINEISPIFNGQSKPNLDCNVDGYFISYPTTTKVLLNRVKNNMACMLEYEIAAAPPRNDHKGRVIVTTLYSDFSYAQNSLSSEEKTLIQNLITYCKDPTTPATQSLKLAQPIVGIGYSVQSPTDVLLNGQDVTFTIKINNTTNEPRTFRVEWDWMHYNRQVMGSYPVPADSEVTIPYTVPNIRGIGGTWQIFVHFYDENNNYVGICSIGGQTYNAGCETKITTEKKEYYPNDTITYNIGITNKTSVIGYSGTIITKILDPNNNKVYETENAYDFNISSYIVNNYSFTLPGASLEGNYIIVSEVKKGTENTEVIGRNSIYFEIPKTKIEIPVELPQVFIPNAINTVRYNITSKEGVKTVNGTIMVSMMNPDNTLIYTETKNFTIAPGGMAPIEFGIPVGNVKFGNYRLEATAYYEGTTAKTINIIPSNATITVNFNKTSYKIRENLGFDVSVFAGGKFQQKDLQVITQITALNYTDEKTKTLNPGEVYTSTHVVNIPGTITAGTYEARVKLVHPPAGGGDSIEKTFNFTVPPANLAIVRSGRDSSSGTQNDTFWQAGQTGNIRVENTGGVDGQWDYVLRLYNYEELPVYEKQGTTISLNPSFATPLEPGSLSALTGQGEQEIFFDLSDQLKSGNS